MNGLYIGDKAEGILQRLTFTGNLCAQLGIKGGRLRATELTIENGEGVGLFALDQSIIEVNQLVLNHHKDVGVLVEDAREVNLSGVQVDQAKVCALFKSTVPTVYRLKDFICKSAMQIGVGLSGASVLELKNGRVSDSLIGIAVFDQAQVQGSLITLTRCQDVGLSIESSPKSTQQKVKLKTTRHRT